MSYKIAEIDVTVTHTGFESPSRTNLGDGIVIYAELKAMPNASWTIGRQNLGGININGLKANSFLDILYNQIWIKPVKIDAGLVTKTEYYDLYIWNAYIETTKTITDVIRYNLPDVYLTSNLDDYVLKPTEEVNTDIVIDGGGVALINGHFEFVVGGDTFYVFVTGKRLLIVPAVHFLADSYKFRYQYEIAKAVNSLLKEQRRLIHPACMRSLSGSVFIPDTNRNFTLNIFDKVGGRVVGISIPHEKLTFTANDIQNLTTIVVNENISNYIELLNAKYLLAFREDNYRYECLVISNVNTSTKTITLESAVIGSFPNTVSVLYPILVSQVTELSLEGKVGNYAIAQISASEVLIE